MKRKEKSKADCQRQGMSSNEALLFLFFFLFSREERNMQLLSIKSWTQLSNEVVFGMPGCVVCVCVILFLGSFPSVTVRCSLLLPLFCVVEMGKVMSTIVVISFLEDAKWYCLAMTCLPPSNQSPNSLFSILVGGWIRWWLIDWWVGLVGC